MSTVPAGTYLYTMFELLPVYCRGVKGLGQAQGSDAKPFIINHREPESPRKEDTVVNSDKTGLTLESEVISRDGGVILGVILQTRFCSIKRIE